MPGQRHPRKNKQHNITQGRFAKIADRPFLMRHFVWEEKMMEMRTKATRTDMKGARTRTLNPLVLILRAHFYTG